MKRISIAALLALLATPASATNLLTATITTAQTGATGTAVQTKDWAPENVSVQCNFVYGSGGTTADVYIQTSLDGGTTWTDLAECSFATASARKVYNVSGLTGGTAALTATDGALASNTAMAQGIMGNRWRTKLVTVGTYAGGTTLNVDVQFGRARSQAAPGSGVF
jgi:hypothetical protein